MEFLHTPPHYVPDTFICMSTGRVFEVTEGDSLEDPRPFFPPSVTVLVLESSVRGLTSDPFGSRPIEVAARAMWRAGADPVEMAYALSRIGPWYAEAADLRTPNGNRVSVLALTDSHEEGLALTDYVTRFSRWLTGTSFTVTDVGTGSADTVYAATMVEAVRSVAETY